MSKLDNLGNVLIRSDLNVPINNGKILDRTRLHIIKSTVEELCSKKNKVFLLSHFGRPKGQFNKKYSLDSQSSASNHHE